MREEAGVFLGFDPVFPKLSLHLSMVGWVSFELVWQDISLEEEVPFKLMPFNGGDESGCRVRFGCGKG